MTAPLIVVEDLHKRFAVGNPLRRLLTRRPAGTREVLRGVSFQVEPGELLALLGPNGAGKTTILKTLATLLLPTSGRVRVGGYDVAAEGRQARGLAGYVLADERSFYWRLTAWQNMEFFAALHGVHGAAARARMQRLLERLDLLGVAHRPFAEFSTGMKQRLAIARALLPRPRVLLMDEPTRSVDPVHAAEVWWLVREEVREAEGCVVLVTHQIGEALSLCERVAILDEGRLVLDTSARSMESLTSQLDGFTVSVRNLAAQDLASLRGFPGVRDIRVASQVAGEQVLEVWTRNGDLPLAGFIGELTGTGATLCSLQRATPLQGILERLDLSPAQEVHA